MGDDLNGMNAGGHGSHSTGLTAEDLLTLRAAFARGENVMATARTCGAKDRSATAATLVAYDLQAGSYVQGVTKDPELQARWCEQAANLLDPWLDGSSTLLEVGCGEATTLAGVLQSVGKKPRQAFGFDISWSRCAVGTHWLAKQGASATVFVADMFAIPLADASIDVVYTSHSLEPNGGREHEALTELLRVARRTVVLVEPIFELANEMAQDRMRRHGYVRGLRDAAAKLGARVADYRLLECSHNPLNPSGVVVLAKDTSAGLSERSAGDVPSLWRCPWTHAPLRCVEDAFFCEASGLAFPILRGIPLLTREHAVVASRLCDFPETTQRVA